MLVSWAHTPTHTNTDLLKEQLNLRELILAKNYWNMKELAGGGEEAEHMQTQRGGREEEGDAEGVSEY